MTTNDTTDQRVCVTCGKPLTNTGVFTYTHADGSLDHPAQPELAQTVDPFADDEWIAADVRFERTQDAAN